METMLALQHDHEEVKQQTQKFWEKQDQLQEETWAVRETSRVI